jgi:hypothetical protein
MPSDALQRSFLFGQTYENATPGTPISLKSNSLILRKFHLFGQHAVLSIRSHQCTLSVLSFPFNATPRDALLRPELSAFARTLEFFKAVSCLGIVLGY